MRTAVALAVAVWLGSACSRSNTISPGVSVAGEWAATDPTQRVMVLNLKQTGTHVSGTGTVGGSPLTTTGSNEISSCSCVCPCAVTFPVTLAIADPSGDTLHADGALVGAPATSDTLALSILQRSGPPPGFPFAGPSITFVRQ
ncbi:MAG TPA: hypothetical protein VK679_16830 [Gemmatimonadaceae bacterium]|nr:hypothetical protein [Gemmatimonadaceae bacterium]